MALNSIVTSVAITITLLIVPMSCMKMPFIQASAPFKMFKLASFEVTFQVLFTSATVIPLHVKFNQTICMVIGLSGVQFGE